MKIIKIKDLDRCDGYVTDRLYAINLDNVKFVTIEPNIWWQFEDGGEPEPGGLIEFNFIGEDDRVSLVLKHGKADAGCETFEDVLARLERLLNE